MSNIIKLLLLLIFITTLSSCVHKTENFTLNTNFVRYHKNDTFDPAFLKFAQQYFILDNMTIKLVGLGDQGEYVNELAESIEISPDRKVITIKLKEEKFSDGSTIEAKDIAMTLKRAALLGSPHTNIENLWVGSSTLKSIDQDIPGIKVIDKKTIVLTLTREAKEILYFLSMADLGILHPTQYRKKKMTIEDWLTVSSGPYRGVLDAEDNITLVINPHYSFPNNDHPTKILFNDQHGTLLPPAVEKSQIDVGFITFMDYLAHDKLISENGYSILGEQYDAIAFLVLNINSNKFKDDRVRQSVLKKVSEKYEVKGRLKKASKKANQFFLPDAMGYVDDIKIQKEIESFKIDDIDLEKALSGKLKIDGIKGMKSYVPNDINELLTSALNIPVEVHLDTPNKNNIEKFKKNRDFDAYIIAVGMSKKVLGEALNLQYLTDPPHLIDPTGKIKKLLNRYQEQDEMQNEASVIGEIIIQMIRDAELIPLYYFAAPFIINKETIKSTKLNLRESIKFHKIRMK